MVKTAQDIDAELVVLVLKMHLAESAGAADEVERLMRLIDVDLDVRNGLERTVIR